MNCRLPVLLAAIFAAGAFGQMKTAPSHYGSFTGFGNVNYPGVGHAPNIIYPNIFNSFPSRLGSSVRGYSGYGYSGYGYAGMGRGAAHPNHSRQVIVPVPIVVGGGYYPYDTTGMGYGPGGYAPGPGYAPAPGYIDPSAVAPPQQQPVTPPVVIINQSYRPEQVNPVVRDYSDADLPPTANPLRSYDAPTSPMPDPAVSGRTRQARTIEDDKPTIYLIAFKDHTILPALAYWVDGDTLNYITEQGTPNRASLSLIDKSFSKQLNRERSVDFALPE